ncbi:MAG: hypothetical protein K8J31_29880, partial [Anaerolineae bacterium]|nr:hypothetical protein [Anaerolineae bacterium]
NYEGAGDLLNELEEVYPAQANERTLNVSAVRRPSTLPQLAEDEAIDSPDFLEGLDGQDDFEAVSSFSLDDDDFSFDDLNDEEGMDRAQSAKTGQGRRLVPILVLLLLIAAIVAIIVLVNPFNNNGSAAVTPTQEIEQAAIPTGTLASVAAPTAEATEQTSATEESVAETDGLESAVQSALQGFEIVENSIQLSDTSLGKTLLVGVCSAPGSALRETLNGSMDALAPVSASVENDVSAIGVALSDCANGNTVLRVIAVPVSDAAAYVNGDISAEEFQGHWAAAA